jgi:uncharacterized protein
MIKSRYIVRNITEDLKEKMVFIGGPRQVGKTTLAQSVSTNSYNNEKTDYLNWDNPIDRKRILEQSFHADAKLLIFDELHKYRHWKNHLKGIYDTNGGRFHILVTGSARLDLYRRGGDSLLGRYHYHRLHPFSVAEMLSNEWSGQQPFSELTFPSNVDTNKHYGDLFAFGGFPEPLLKHDERTLRRWHNERIERLVKDDIRDVEMVRDLSALQILSDVLPSRVGSKLSLNSLRKDLQVTHKTISHWVDILERFYYHFRLYPYQSKFFSALRKEPKLYLYDWSQVHDEGARLENMVASHLLKLVHFLYDVQGYKAELWFLGDKEGREVDFLVTIDKKPWFGVEAKLSDTSSSKWLNYFADKLNIPYLYQVVGVDDLDIIQNNVRIISASKFLSGLV